MSPKSETNPKVIACPVRFCAWFAYQDDEWVFTELKAAEEGAWVKCKGCPSFGLLKESKDRLDQHRQRWKTATGR